MDTKAIETLFTAAGLTVDLIAEAAPADCPFCSGPPMADLAEAA